MKLHKIADLYVGVDYKHDTMIKQAEKYLTSEKPEVVDIVVWASEESLNQLKNKEPSLSVDECEYLITGANFYNCLIGFNGMMIHASAVAYKGGAYLFSADPGTGKSTHTGLWLKAFGEEARILNDDKPAVRIFDDGVYAYGTPWSGKTDFNSNEKLPLKGICFIHQAKENNIVRVDGSEAVADLMKQTVRPYDKSRMCDMLSLLDVLLTKVPVYKMGCNMDIEAAYVAYEAMKD